MSRPGYGRPARRGPDWLRHLRRLVPAGLVSAGLASCGPGIVPPTVSVASGQLVGAGLLDQQLQLVLCVSNPNARAIDLARVTFALTMAGDTLASGVSEAPLDLPPGGSVPVPFAVSTSLRDIGAPLSRLLDQGTLGYSVSGTVLLRDFTLIGIPYSVEGRIDPIAMAQRMLSLQPSASSAPSCSASPSGTDAPVPSSRQPAPYQPAPYQPATRSD